MHACVGWQRLPRQITTTQSRATPRQGTTRRKGGLGGVARGVSGSQMGQPDGEQCGLTCGMPKQRVLARIARRGGRKGTCDAPWRAPDFHKGWEVLSACLQSPRARTGRGLGAQSVAGGAEITQRSSRGGTISASTGESYGINHRASPTRGGSARGRLEITASGAYASP